MRIIVALVLVLALAGPAWAAPKGNQGRHGGVAASDSEAVTNRPPGLAKQDKVPHGLEKQGKTPAGWSKGHKRGWFDWLTGKKHEEADKESQRTGK